MNIDFNVEIKGLNGKKIPREKIIAAEQLSNLVLSDRGGAAKTAREAYQINGLMQRIACATKPVDVTEDEIKLLEKVLDSAISQKTVSTFLVGRLFGILEGKTEDK